MKFIHAADIHLDSQPRGLSRYEGVPGGRIHDATREALRNMVDLTLAEQVRFVVIAGDLYDGDWQDYSTGLHFAREMARLRPAGIDVVLLYGNHDAESRITRKLTLPDNVKVFPHRKPDSFRFEADGVAFHGQSFARRDIQDDLSAGYPAPLPGLLNVAVLHTAATGRDGHDRYAPCRPDALAQAGHDYWALGHVHEREELGTKPYIVFPGNLQGRHIREAGAKGCTLVTVRDRHIEAVEHRPVDVLRWATVDVDAGGCAALPDVLVDLERVLEAAVAAADGRLLAARVRIQGMTALHGALAGDPEHVVNEIRARAIDIGQEAVWIEKVKFETKPRVSIEEMRRRDDALGILVRTIDEISGSASETRALLEELAGIVDKVPRAARGPDTLAHAVESGRLDALVEQARSLLLSRLTEKAVTS